jgi:hypothetical protein
VTVDLTQTKRPYAKRIAYGIELIFSEDNQRIGTLKTVHGETNLFQPVLSGSGMNEVSYDFGISRAVKFIALFCEFPAEMFGVYNVAVVSNGQNIITITGDYGLSITYTAGACG